MESAGDPTIRRLRAQIAAVDAEIVAAVNRRIELVGQIRRYKQEAGLTFVDRAQEAANLERLAEQNDGPLSAEGLRRLYRDVLELSKRESD